jgi:hypothetical protein
MSAATPQAQRRAACPRWLSSQCHAGPECACNPPNAPEPRPADPKPQETRR